MPNPFFEEQHQAPAPQQAEFRQDVQHDLSIIQDRELQQAGFQEALRQGQELLDSKYKLLGVTHKDSLEMSKIKSSEKTLLRFFSEEKFAADSKMFTQQLDTATFLYNQLIHNCEAYENSHKRPWTASGKARKRMVQQVQKIAQHEVGKLKSTAEILRKRNPETGSWADVLGAMRVANISLDSHQTEKTGGGTSDVTVINYPNTKLFFKKDEVLNPITDDTKTLIEQTPEFGKYQDVLKKLLKHIDPKDPLSAVNFPVSHYLNWEIFEAQVSSIIKFTEEEKKQLQDVLPAFSPLFAKITTRYYVADQAGIQPGRVLSSRNIATSRLAGLLGVSGLVTDSAAVTLSSRQTQEEKGVVTVQAKGKQFNELRDDHLPLVASPKLLKELINLQILDTLCGQLDRNLSNLFFQYEDRDGKRVLTSVTGIDSDMAFGVVNYAELESNQDGFLQLLPIESEGICMLPHLDQTFCSNILALDKDTVSYVLGDLLNQQELDALWERIAKVRALLLKNVNLMTDAEWPKANLESRRTEYGKSYLKKISDHLDPNS